MEEGWVYVFVNSSIPGMAKVGRTTRQPEDRAAELSAATGVATPFIVAFDQPFADCMEAERLIHEELDRRGLRVAANREFFRGTPSEIIRVILEIADGAVAVPSIGPPPCADRLRQAGDSALYGFGDTLQDMGEALRLYKIAALRGSLLAFERIGHIYVSLYLASRDRTERRRLLNALKEGARRGNYYCYCELGVLFAVERHASNFNKTWDLFFSRRTNAFKTELEADTGRYATACARYIEQSLELGVKPDHFGELAGAAECIMANLLNKIDAARDAPATRQRLATTLRWAYENLQPQPRSAYAPQAPALHPSPGWVSEHSVAIA